nr:retrovirus-related Pol polyprotein from transposon TNT 1-94 [Tanacetum cinerariifolium]
MENLNEVRVKELRSDNGTEFRNHKLKGFCDEKRGRSPDINYFHVFWCPIHIHNHMDHLGKFDKKVDDGFFLGYSPVAKAFRDSIKSSVSESITEELPQVEAQRVQDLRIMFHDMVYFLEATKVFKKANAEGKKWEKNNPETPKDIDV